jgi:hypothetical protein
MFASVTNGITERTRSLHHSSLMNAASRHFRYFSEAEHHGIFCFAPSKRRHDMSSEIGPYLFGTIRRDFLAVNVINCVR